MRFQTCPRTSDLLLIVVQVKGASGSAQSPGVFPRRDSQQKDDLRKLVYSKVQCAVPLPFVVPSALLGRRSCSCVCVPSGCCRRHIHPRLIKLCPWQPQEKDAQRLNCRRSFYRRVEISTKHVEWFYHPGSMQHPELGRAESMRRLKCRGRDIPVWLRRYLLRSPRYLTLAWPSNPPKLSMQFPPSSMDWWCISSQWSVRDEEKSLGKA